MRILLLTVICLIANPVFAQTMMQGSASSLDFRVNGTIQASATSAGNLVVRSDPTAANHVATKNYHDSNTPAETDPQVNAVTNGQWCRGTGSQVTCDQSAPVTSETDPQVSAVTNGQWCRGTGSQVTCDQSAPVTSETDPQVGSVTNNQWCRGNGSQVTCDQTAPGSSSGSQGTNGWADIGGGHIIQYGRSSAMTGNTKCVTFPKAFPTAVRSIVLTMHDNDTGHSYTQRVYSFSATQFCFWSQNSGGHGQYYFWQAIGY